MFVTPAHTTWAPVGSFFSFRTHQINEPAVREVSKLLLDRISGNNLLDFHVVSVARAMSFLEQSEQLEVLQILRNHYVE
jgi:hypothetical protein